MIALTFCILLALSASVSSIGIPLHQGPRCMIIQGQYDPIKLELQFPAIPNKQQDEKFKLTIEEYTSSDLILDVFLEQKAIYRKNLELAYNKIYNLCIFVWATRSGFDPIKQQIYVQYKAHEDFDSLIGNFQIPSELATEKNLAYIYNVSMSITNLNKRVRENQRRERQNEDRLSLSSIQKNKRITTFTVIECVVIVVSGLYQVLSLRRFLIEKNLY